MANARRRALRKSRAQVGLARIALAPGALVGVSHVSKARLRSELGYGRNRLSKAVLTPPRRFGFSRLNVPRIVHESAGGSASFTSMTKAELHELVDLLPDASLEAAGALLRRAQDPVLAKLDAAPYDDEPLTDEDRVALEAARREPAVSWSEASSELSAD